jgi:hypothetical protein
MSEYGGLEGGGGVDTDKGKTEVFGEKAVPGLLCLPQMLH